MLIKWIVCQVTPQQKEAFHRAQEQWGLLKEAEGFLGQWGGWNLDQPFEARILSLWQTPAHYEWFMNQLHDEILQQNRQNATYESIHVDHAENAISFGDASAFARSNPDPLLKVSDWEVPPRSLVPFLKGIRSLTITGFLHQLPNSPTCFRLFEMVTKESEPTQKSVFPEAILKRETVIPIEPDWLVLPQ